MDSQWPHAWLWHLVFLVHCFCNSKPYGVISHIFGDRFLTHWGRVTHICISKMTIIGSDNGLSPDRRQAIIWTNAALLSIGPLRTYFNENLIKIQQFSLTKMHVKMSSAKWLPSCLGLNVLTLNMRGLSYLGLPRSISWLLMPWLLMSPGHQQPWYWLYRISWSFYCLRKDFEYLCHINVEKWHKM